MVLLKQSLHAFCRHAGLAATYWVAYSGGMDSHVLLHALSEVRKNYSIKIHAVYINHSLSASAQMWGDHCAYQCRQLDIPFSLYQIDANAHVGESPEEKARRKRYAILTALLDRGDYLLTAHHQDDQAETLLLQMLRGAGPKGLAAMPAAKPLGLGFHARPLLQFSRQCLHAYAQHYNLQWQNDESNSDTAFSRNYLRHNIMPLLKARWPAVTATLARVADNCADTQCLLNTVVSDDLAKIQGLLPNTIIVSELKKIAVVRQRHVLRAWLSQLGYPLPSAVKLRHLQSDVVNAALDKYPCVSWQGCEVRRYQNNLYAMQPLAPFSASACYAWDFKESLSIPGIGIISATPTFGNGISELQGITVRFRQGGEQCQLPGREHQHYLKKLLQEWQVPPWQRNRIPLVFRGNELVAVTHLYLNERYRAGKGQAGYTITLEEQPIGSARQAAQPC